MSFWYCTKCLRPLPTVLCKYCSPKEAEEVEQWIQEQRAQEMIPLSGDGDSA